jgi:imidazolonepropionase
VEPFVFASGFHPNKQPASNLQTVLSLACLDYGLSPEQAITAITYNAACAIGLSAKIGSLEPDKQADILLLDVPEYHEIPYHFGVNLVRGVIQRGRVVYWRGEIEWTDKS